MDRKKIIVTEKIADEGIEILKKECDLDYRDGISRHDLLEIIGNYDGLMVRSVTKVDEELTKKGIPRLKVIGRAGIGVDNIDVDACTRYGVIVTNTPDSNTISAAEQTIGLLLSAVRNTAWANGFLKGGNWDRKPFRGVELYGKTVGIVGLGRIGSMVAARLKAFHMDVIAYDPYIADERFERFGAKKKNTLEELAAEADVITVHTPRTDETHHMINEKILAHVKDGVILINCARGGIIKETALLDGLKSGKIGCAGMDVFEKEPAIGNPLFEFNKVVVTPHLGADTFEGQKRVGENIAKQVIELFNGDIGANVVNLPVMLTEELEYLRPYIALGEKLGNFYYQMEKSPVNNIDLSYCGPISKNETEMLTVAFLKGLLEPVLDEKVNYVNARLMAEERGIRVFVQKEEQSSKRYKNIISASLSNAGRELQLVGTVSRAKNPLLVEINGYETEASLEGFVIIVEHEDRPRVIGPFATALGDEGINIASMNVARKVKGEKAIMMLNVDNMVKEDVLERISKVNGVVSKAKLLKF